MKTIELTNERVRTLQFCAINLQMIKQLPFTDKDDKQLLDAHTSVLEKMIKEYENATNKRTKSTSD